VTSSVSGKRSPAELTARVPRRDATRAGIPPRDADRISPAKRPQADDCVHGRTRSAHRWVPQRLPANPLSDQADQADANAKLVEASCAELHRSRPDGASYATFRLDDQVTFVHIVQVRQEPSPLLAVEASGEFQAGIAEPIDQPPITEELTEVGSYLFFGAKRSRRPGPRWPGPARPGAPRAHPATSARAPVPSARLLYGQRHQVVGEGPADRDTFFAECVRRWLDFMSLG
jgi:hypothetical protein